MPEVPSLLGPGLLGQAQSPSNRRVLPWRDADRSRRWHSLEVEQGEGREGRGNDDDEEEDLEPGHRSALAAMLEEPSHLLRATRSPRMATTHLLRGRAMVSDLHSDLQDPSTESPRSGLLPPIARYTSSETGPPASFHGKPAVRVHSVEIPRAPPLRAGHIQGTSDNCISDSSVDSQGLQSNDAAVDRSRTRDATLRRVLEELEADLEQDPEGTTGPEVLVSGDALLPKNSCDAEAHPLCSGDTLALGVSGRFVRSQSSPARDGPDGARRRGSLLERTDTTLHRARCKVDQQRAAEATWCQLEAQLRDAQALRSARLREVEQRMQQPHVGDKELLALRSEHERLSQLKKEDDEAMESAQAAHKQELEAVQLDAEEQRVWRGAGALRALRHLSPETRSPRSGQSPRPSRPSPANTVTPTPRAEGDTLKTAKAKEAQEHALLENWQREDTEWRAAQRQRTNRIKEIDAALARFLWSDDHEDLQREKATLVQAKKAADAAQTSLRDRRAAQLAALQLTAEERRALKGPGGLSPKSPRPKRSPIIVEPDVEEMEPAGSSLSLPPCSTSRASSHAEPKTSPR